MIPREALAAIRAAAVTPPTPKIRARYRVGLDPAGDRLTFVEVTPGGQVVPMPVTWDGILRTYASALMNEGVTDE